MIAEQISMWPTSLSLLSGLAFGSALTLSGVAAPQVIRNQFVLTDFHMLLTFLTASASSAIAITIYNSRADTPLWRKPNSTFSWVGRFDGTIVGGAMIGAGMALTGACPGTALVQAAAGIGRSRLVVSSAMMAGIVFAKLKIHLGQRPSAATDKQTIMDVGGWSSTAVVTMYEALMLSIIMSTLMLAPRSHAFVHPLVGGWLIGIGQIASLVLMRKTVGVSAAYEDIGKLFWAAVEAKSTSPSDSVTFAAGIVVGARLVIHLVPETLAFMSATDDVGTTTALVGGFLLAFGARLAGGCTSGHGISGMSGMRLGSIIAVMSMFGSAIVTSFLLK